MAQPENDQQKGPTPLGMPKLTEWAKEPQLEALKLDLQNARPMQNGHITKVNTWLDNLHIRGTAAIKPVAGRSSVQPRLIRKHAEWRYADLSEPFLSSEKIFAVSPRSWEDREAARQNEMVLNWQMDTKLNKVTLIDQLVRTIVDAGTVILRTGWERQTEMVKVAVPVWGYFPMTRPEEIQALQQAIQTVQQKPEALKGLHPTIAESVRYSMEKGAPFKALQMREEMVDQEKVLANHPTVEIASIFNLVVDPSCGYDFDKAMFMAYSMEVTVGSLKANPQRYKNMDSIDNGHSPLSEPDHVRPGDVKGSEFNFSDDRKKVVLNEMWLNFDIDGSGKMVPIVVAWVGNVMVRCEKNPFPDGKPPFVIIPLLPMKESVYGEPDGELLTENQKIIGAITRGMIDLMGRSANAQRGMAKNMLDVVNKRRFDAGLDYEFNPNVHPANGVVEHKFPEIPNSAPAMVSMQSLEAESLTGVKTFGEDGLNGAGLGPTAAGVKGVLSATSRRTNGILRRLAKGMSQVGSKILAMNQLFMSQEEVVRVTNKDFVTVNRDDIQGSFDTVVDIATAEENEARANRLEFLLQTMGNTADPEVAKMILVEIARLRRMPDLAHRLETYQPQPDPLQQRKLEAEVALLEAEVMESQAKAKESMARADKAAAEARLAQAQADIADLNYVEQDTGTKHARDVDKIGAQARANTDHTITKAILEQGNGRGPDGKVDTSPTPENINDAFAFNAAQPA